LGLIALVLSEEGGMLAVSASVWPWDTPNLLKRLLPNVLRVSALLLGTAVVSTSSKFSCQTLIKGKIRFEE